ncbi:MAG: isopeptide-forming domain-containing fimbrial protein [Coriobacteriales bacterium]|nr:isopeptide-forming domain-containing fimbrial protein [Coriobacteriales bacterium]
MSTSAGGSFVARTTEVTYTVSQKVASDATFLTIAVNLEPVLALSSSSVSVGLDGGGSIEAASNIEGQKLSASVPQAADLRGKTILVTYKAKVRDDAKLGPYTNAAGTTASIPYQARTTFVGATTREVASDVESVKVALGSGSSSSGSTSAGSTSTTASTLPRTSEPNAGAMAAALAVGGTCLAMVGTRSRRHVG